jgi:hypothetical protein
VCACVGTVGESWGLDLGILASPLPAGKYGVERHVLMLTLQTHMLCKAMSPASPGLSPPGSIQHPLRALKHSKHVLKEVSVCTTQPGDQNDY